MILAKLLTTYLALNLLIGIGFLFLYGIHSIFKLEKRLKSKFVLEMQYGLIWVILALTLVHPLLPENEVFQPVARIWASAEAKNYTAQKSISVMSLPSFQDKLAVPTDWISKGWILFGLVALGIALYRLLSDLFSLYRIKKNSFLTRRIGDVCIYVNEEIQVPFSYLLLTKACVVLPGYLVEKPQDYKIAITHELQHHRQGDTRWVYGIWALRWLCGLNPFIHLWAKWIEEIQEFACDEALVDQQKVSSQAYASCLVQVAQTAIVQKYKPVCATGLLFLSDRHILNRRIEKMLSQQKQKIGRSISIGIGILLTATLATTAYAAKGLVQDRRVSMAQAQQMAQKASVGTDFPIVVNDLVLQELNRYIGTPGGREFMRKSLQRMQNFRSAVEAGLQQYNMPMEIMAVPIVESGYQNLPQSSHRSSGAGIWMFIVSTARVYGLKVDSLVDERLNVDLETDAAMRYLSSNNFRFKNWLLSLLAYNVGENKVSQEMARFRTSDPWLLIRNGIENDTQYLAKVMAAVLIMKNPESVQ